MSDPIPVFDPKVALKKALLAALASLVSLVGGALATITPEQLTAFLLASDFSQTVTLVAVPVLMGLIRLALNYQKMTKKKS